MVESRTQSTAHPARKALIRLFLLCLVTILVLGFSLGMGSTDLSLTQAWSALLADEDSVAARIVQGVRFPRLMAAFSVGGLLGIAGAIFQVLVRNPLAEPYVMGTAGGAAAFYLLAAIAGATPTWHPVAAFCGALFSTAIVAWFAQIGRNTDPIRLLLTGVMIAAGWGALITLILSLTPASHLPGLLFWLLGDLNEADRWPLAAGTLAMGLILALLISRALNLMAYGGLGATALGVNLTRVQTLAFLIASLVTGVAVAVAGPIGFIGLIAPHLVRRTIGADHRILIPASLLMGGCLLVLADGLARTSVAPLQLPVGVITALIGVPAFLALLVTGDRRER